MTKKSDKKEKPRKVRIKESKSFSADAVIEIDAQRFYSGLPCGNKNCVNNKECPDCHRINAIGNALIVQRTGPVHLERLAKYDIAAFNNIPETERESKTLKIYYF